uniref:Uncharacterized protein n=1 Tax=Romanomermis culicivorax TaxID=13658 RepID=A0A915IEE8_ROMCU
MKLFVGTLAQNTIVHNIFHTNHAYRMANRIPLLRATEGSLRAAEGSEIYLTVYSGTDSTKVFSIGWNNIKRCGNRTYFYILCTRGTEIGTEQFDFQIKESEPEPIL